MTSKRPFLDFVSGSDPNITILTHDSQRIPAHSDVLRLVCSCLKNAPASTTWDLQQLVVNSKPVASDTVATVLEYIYGNMGAMDVTFDDRPGRLSMLQLQDMLLFVDAVGCSKRILQGIVGLLDVCVRQQLEMAGDGDNTLSGHSSGSRPNATEEAQQPVVLKLGSMYTLRDRDGMLMSWKDDKGTDIVVLNSKQQQQLRQAAAEQVEQLLFTAFKLDAGPLASCMLRFLRTNAATGAAILADQTTLKAVFTPRVLSMAGHCSMGSELLSRACLQLPLGRGFGIGTVFEVDESTITSTSLNVSFEAQLLRNLYDFRKGAVVEVEIDLVEGELKMGKPGGDVPTSYAFSTGLHHRDWFP